MVINYDVPLEILQFAFHNAASSLEWDAVQQQNKL